MAGTNSPSWRGGSTLLALLAAALAGAWGNLQALDCAVTARPSRDALLRTGSTYPAAPTSGETTLRTGQAADIVLSGVDFDDAGGPLLFNHNGGLATDGRRLLLCDRNNNRVLVWSQLPTGNVPPDLVLGQTDFRGNDPGTSRDAMNWPIAVSTDGTRVLVADAYNDRILVWTSFPSRNGQPADLVLQSPRGAGPGTQGNPKAQYPWPWGVWTDGTRVVVTATGGGSVLVWNTFPVRDDQPADVRLTAQGKLGTPRGVVSDGRSLIVGDHNARGTTGQLGNWVWKTFPTVDEAPPDYFLKDPCDANAGQMNGEITADGKLLLLGRSLYIWNTVPATDATPPDLALKFDFFGGDGSDVAVAGSRIYVSTANGNRVVSYAALPTSADQLPDSVLGSPDLTTNTLDTAFIASNPIPASNGRSLFVSSDFDRRLSVWKSLPDRSGAAPDFVYQLTDSPWDNALRGETLVLAGNRSVWIWRRLPLDGEPPDAIFQGRIGDVTFGRLSGVALDDRYFYLSDVDRGKVHVFRGIPSATDSPAFSLDLTDAARLDSDGTHLVVTRTLTQGQQVLVYDVASLSATSQGTPIAIRSGARFNLPQYATITAGRLFVGDTNNNRVLSWSRIQSALQGDDPDLILGAADLAARPPMIGRSTLFWPAAPVFDGRYLWVGEFKFSERLLRFGGGATTPAPVQDTLSYVPAVAGGPGASGASWTTDLTLYNPDPSARTVNLAFLPAGRDNRSAPEVAVSVPGKRAITLPSVVGATLGASGGGGVRLRVTDASVLATSRTYDANAVAGRFTGVNVSALPSTAALTRGTLFPLASQSGPSGTRVNAGFLNPGAEALRVELDLVDATSGAALGRTSLDVPPLGFQQINDVFASLGVSRDVLAGVLTFTSTAPVFGYGIVLENATSVGRYIAASP